MSLLDPAFAAPDFTWNERAARHLLNRAGFGVPPSAIVKLAAMKPDEAVTAFVDFDRYPDPLPAPDWIPAPVSYRDMRKVNESLSEDEKRRVRQMFQRESNDYMSQLQVWWLDRMCRSQRPLEEKLTLFWHGHFATSSEKVKDPAPNYQLNQILRTHGAGNFKTLVTAVGKSPAMMRYLDQVQSNREKPNENWARELMELFTLGIGNYTEQDIKEAARAFTGWSDRDGQFQFAPRRHDPGSKTFLGRTGNFDGDQIIAIILEQPACAEFICRKLWKYFAYDDPEPEIVSELATIFRQGGYEIKPVLRKMFSSRAFYTDRAIASQVKSPAQLVVNLLVQLEAPLDDKPPIAQLAMRAMGQSLFAPPNVKGWDGGRAWVNTNTLLVRFNFSNFLVSGVVPQFGGAGGGGGKLIKELKQAMERKSQLAAGRRSPGNAPGKRPRDMAMMDGGDNAMMSGASGADDAMSMSAMDGEKPDVMPAGQDAMPADNPNRTLYGALAKRKRPAKGERKENDREYSMLAPFKVHHLFARFEGMTAPEMVDQLALYFIGFPLEGGQRDKLIAALSKNVKPTQPLSITQIPEDDLRATVQLLLSTVDYQVC